MKRLLQALLPPLVLALLLGGAMLLPKHFQLVDAGVSSKLPLGYELPGWYGSYRQESKLERDSLPMDTRFSKADYENANSGLPPVAASIVFSGNDMNASIHRPERCLPSQGHFNLRTESREIPLDDGVTLHFTRLASTSLYTRAEGAPKQRIEHVNYYIFIGYNQIRSTHLERTLQDMFDRIVYGRAQRWAYLQVGSYWSEDLGLHEADCDRQIQQVLAKLLPLIIKPEILKSKR